MKKEFMNLKIKERVSAVLGRLNSSTTLIVENDQEKVGISSPKQPRAKLLASHLKYSHSMGKKY